jgi:hypothetical protein
MKASMPILLWALVLGGTMPPTLHAGNEIFLYPLARAFGAPREAELVRCRTAFQGLQSRLAASRVLVAPVLFVDGPRREWRKDLAEAMVQEMQARVGASFEVVGAAPDVAPARFRRNQLRYLWERGAQYAGWVKAAPPAGDYVWCAEIWGHGGKVAAIQVYILDPAGQVAYCRLFNSHHFGNQLPLEGDDAVRLVVNALVRDLQRDPKALFPPYGVG